MKFKKTQEKWIKKWQDSKIFEASPVKGKKKFFGTFPYPYVNSYLHLGHFYSSMRLEALSRYKRMQGYNVLYTQGWHCTGSPIVNAARRIKEKEPIQWDILRKQGFSEEQIKKFEEPEAWVRYFPKEAQKDFTAMGYSIDWRRQFITTELNPHYDRFIRWQFRKLRAGRYVLKGKFPVVWDPVENNPVGDHARLEGEGETPQEYVLVKHKMDDKWVVSATLRPDTIMGVTNLYVNPESDLVEAKVNDETWIISEKTAKELGYQDKKVEIIRQIKGKDLIGKKVKEFAGNEVLILPAGFVSTHVGTGIVHSVPSDSADDLIALYDLQNNENEIKAAGLDAGEVRAIKPIAVIEIPGYGKIPAEDVIKKLGIKNQKDSEKLKQAKALLYSDGFYKGKLNSLYSSKKLSRDYSGKKVEEVKDQIKDDLVKSDYGDIYYQLTGRVVARSLGECLVKIVEDQWFMAYGDEKWKKKTHKCLDKMKLYPEKTRSQFNYVLDWLKNWACTREFGLGTKLPWDEKWIIESLSDSTIYMAFYTIFHKLKEINPDKLDDNFFDYVFLGKNTEIKVSKKIADELREEFEYWYPMDFRTTGKDLIQNHMSFCLFNHTAIFPEKHWPRSYGLNGHVMVDGEKMSKSKGNFIIIRQALKDYGADASRFTALSGGEGIDDANFDTELARSMESKLNSMLEFAKQNYSKGRSARMAIDDWMDARINKIILETTKCYDETLLRSALQNCYFEMQNALRWYMRRTVNNPNEETMKKFIEVQALLLAPITPFTAEEIWEAIGKKGFIAQAEWPAYDEKLSVPETELLEERIKTTVDDINSVLNIVNIKFPKKIMLFVAEQWKYDVYKLLGKEMKKTRDFSTIMGAAMKKEEFKKHSKEISGMIQ
ncbi:leucine--tRNA ligase, partial [Candidatus Woesearchaeota archaeon]|nr:leucine--tRNA ligase [Candidatus Woesearchaeota archaeon]